MLKTLKIAILLSTTSLCLESFSQISKSTAPQWVEMYEIDDLSQNSVIENASGGIHYLILDKQEHVENKTLFSHYAYKITSTNGVQENSQVSVSYDPSYENIIFHELNIYRDNQKIDKLDIKKFNEIQRETELEKHLYDASITAYLNLKDVRVGDIVEFKYSRIGKNPIHKNMFFTTQYFNYTIPIKKIRYKLITDKTKTYYHKCINGDLKPSVDILGKEKIYTWLSQGVVPVDLDDYLPEWYDPFVSIRISEFSSWRELNQWAKSLFVLDSYKSTEIDEFIKRIKLETNDKNIQMNEIINFVQSEVRYLGLEGGISGYKPHAPEQVFTQRYGDCKDKSLLLVKLLEMIDLKAFPVLLNSAYRQEIIDFLPSPDVFNHCVVLAQKDGEDIWIDPTINQQGGNAYKHYFPNYKKALVVNDEFENLTSIPYNGISNISVVEKFTIDDFESSVFFEIETVYKGYEADYQRRYLQNQLIDEVNKDYLNYYANYYPEINIYDTLQIEDDKYHNVITIKESYDIYNFWSVVDETSTVVTAEFVPALLIPYFLEPNIQIRSMPLSVNYPVNVQFKTIVNLPKEWAIENSSQSINSPSFDLSVNTTYYDKVFTMDYDFKTVKNTVEPEEMKDYLKSLRKVDNEIGYTISYDKNIQNNAFGGISWFMVFIGVITLILGVYYSIKVYNQYDPIGLEERIAYPSIGGWLILPAIGLCVSPFIYLYSIYSNEYITGGAFDMAFNRLFVNYNPSLGIAIIGEYVFQLLFLCMVILLLVLFFKRRSSVPKLMVIFYGSNLIFLIITVIVLSVIDIVDQSIVEESYKSVFKALVSSAIWIPYFLNSDRAKETFVVRLKP